MLCADSCSYLQFKVQYNTVRPHESCLGLGGRCHWSTMHPDTWSIPTTVKCLSSTPADFRGAFALDHGRRICGAVGAVPMPARPDVHADVFFHGHSIERHSRWPAFGNTVSVSRSPYDVIGGGWSWQLSETREPRQTQVFLPQGVCRR